MLVVDYLGLSVLVIIVALMLLMYLAYRKIAVVRWLAKTKYRVTGLVSLNKASEQYTQHSLMETSKGKSVIEILFHYTLVTSYADGGEFRIPSLGVLRCESDVDFSELTGWIARWMLYRLLINTHFAGNGFLVRDLVIQDVEYYTENLAETSHPQLLLDYRRGYYT